jgi:AcrR family transcriptional regulator
MAPRSTQENQRIRDERRDQILTAAAKVFSRKGLAAAKITEVATQAGVSHGLVYHYFPSKEDLFAALLDQALTGSVWVTQGALAQPGTPRDQLHWMLSLMLGSVCVQPDLFLTVIQAFTSDAVPRGARETALQQGAVSRAAVAQLIASGQATGQFRSGDPERFAMTLLAVINGLAVGVAADPGLIPQFPDADTLLSMLKP